MEKIVIIIRPFIDHSERKKNKVSDWKEEEIRKKYVGVTRFISCKLYQFYEISEFLIAYATFYRKEHEISVVFYGEFEASLLLKTAALCSSIGFKIETRGKFGDIETHKFANHG